MADNSHKVNIKIILLGDSGVGKTTFFFRVRDQDFVDTDNRATVSIGVEDLRYEHKIDDATITVYLNDTGGGERFRTLTSNYYRHASAAILMYSVEDSYTFNNLQWWVEKAQEAVDVDRFVWAVVGNKSDLPSEIEHEHIDVFSKQLGTKLCFFTSAKTGENVQDSMDAIVEEVYRRRRNLPVLSKPTAIKLDEKSKPGSCSC